MFFEIRILSMIHLNTENTYQESQVVAVAESCKRKSKIGRMLLALTVSLHHLHADIFPKFESTVVPNMSRHFMLWIELLINFNI